MIIEVATIDVRPGLAAEFESGVEAAMPVFMRAKGYRSLRLEQSLERPLRYRLVVGWDTLEDHTVHFRNSSEFQVWRSLVAHTFAAPPEVEHSAILFAAVEPS